MRILFLDIDGVLNSDIWIRSIKGNNGQFPYNQFDTKAIELLNRMTERTNAKIVLTSMWRLKRSLCLMQQIFLEVGIKGEIIAFTPNLKKDNESLIESKVMDYTDFAILDDNSDMLYWQANFFFQTDRCCGLTPTIAKRVIKHFKCS